MGVFHVFKIIQMTLNRSKRLIFRDCFEMMFQILKMLYNCQNKIHRNNNFFQIKCLYYELVCWLIKDYLLGEPNSNVGCLHPYSHPWNFKTVGPLKIYQFKIHQLPLLLQRRWQTQIPILFFLMVFTYLMYLTISVTLFMLDSHEL